jgi:hypothetical protein
VKRPFVAANPDGVGQHKRMRDKQAMTCTFKLKDFFKNASKLSPSADELQDQLLKLLKEQKPELLMSRFQVIAKETRERSLVTNPTIREHQFLFTIPYWANSQPAELLWQCSKGRSGTAWYENRSLRECHQHWLAALYGGTVRCSLSHDESIYGSTVTWSALGPAKMQSFIRRSDHEIQVFMDDQDEFKGMLLKDVHSLLPADFEIRAERLRIWETRLEEQVEPDEEEDEEGEGGAYDGGI